MFRSFEGSTADDVWQKIALSFKRRDGVTVQESRGGPTKEILHSTIAINDSRQRWVVSRHPPINVAFAIAEVVWIMAGRNDLAFLEFWNSRLKEYVGPGPTLHGAYGYRLRKHLGLDQLERAYLTLDRDPKSRQIALQIWDSSIDLPFTTGESADQDIPCNMLSLLKIRDGKLEWLQVLRSNDLFLGVPYNFVQFTCLQEIMAGWLGIECGPYHQLSDSLHIYERDETTVAGYLPVDDVPINTDSLLLPKESSERAFKEIEQRIDRMVVANLREEELQNISEWDEGPEAFQNMLAVLVAEAARRHKWLDIAERAISTCTNPAFKMLWGRWQTYLVSSRSQQESPEDF